jgi:hypothetical protein
MSLFNVKFFLFEIANIDGAISFGFLPSSQGVEQKHANARMKVVHENRYGQTPQAAW